MDIASLQVPDELFRDGLWVEAPDLGPGVAWRICSPDTPAYQRLYDRLIGELPIEKRFPPDAEAIDAVQYRCIAEVLLKDWRGLTVDGKPVPFSPTQALEWLTVPRFVRIRRSIRAAANRVEALGKVEAAAEGNSSPAT